MQPFLNWGHLCSVWTQLGKPLCAQQCAQGLWDELVVDLPLMLWLAQCHRFSCQKVTADRLGSDEHELGDQMKISKGRSRWNQSSVWIQGVGCRAPAPSSGACLAPMVGDPLGTLGQTQLWGGAGQCDTPTLSECLMELVSVTPWHSGASAWLCPGVWVTTGGMCHTLCFPSTKANPAMWHKVKELC